MGDRIYVVTGSSSGIGYATAVKLVAADQRVVMLCRNTDQSRDARDRLLRETGAPSDRVDLVYADLGSRDSTQAAIDEINDRYEVIDGLINNAGVFRRKRNLAADGNEQNLSVNYLAVVQLSSGLLPLVRAAEQGRIVNVSSDNFKKAKVNLSDLQSEHGYRAGNAYAASKLMTVLYTVRLARFMGNTKVTVNAGHPGVANSNVFKDYPKIVMWLLKPFTSSCAEVAESPYYLATAPELDDVTGEYFYKKKVDEQWRSTVAKLGPGFSDRLWSLTRELLAGYSCEPE
ncbi:MAG: SDR family NAD(P)-dependent oxidoreductase [Actinobacteria bacterium]|nr:SDR family NAD(P)-dependent oxidoreductase [Actinomycetota bacterium]MCB9411520.1 SDR family NAD(P)-dependent oxidoreductase [Actinomycetota bacterium]